MAKRGRPTKYKKQYCEDIVAFFDVPRTEEKIIPHITASGVAKIRKEKAREFPTLIDFAHKIGVTTQTIWEWTTKHPEFSYSVQRAKELQENFLVKNGLDGYYQPQIFALVATNFTSMKDKSSREITGKDGGPIDTKITVEFVDAAGD
jgi:hypothetical protein